MVLFTMDPDQGQPQTQQQQLHLGRDNTASATVCESESVPDSGSTPHASAFIFLLGPFFCLGRPTFPLPLQEWSVFIDGRLTLFLWISCLPDLLSDLKLLKTHSQNKTKR